MGTFPYYFAIFGKNPCMMDKKIRVRFAPSPTGPLHIGGVRTALFNYLFARKHNGTFILRIEDTDQGRYVPGAEEYIIESLKWCGIIIDEGVTAGGPYEPYRQSERKNIYLEYAERLLASGHAYEAFDSPEQLEQLRKQYESERKTFIYDASVRNNLNNSLVLGREEVEKLKESGVPYVVRFMMPENKEVNFDDIVRGRVVVNTATLDDKVLLKADGMPTYHLANVVDDYLMEITHVIRGEEWLPSTPLHVLLYKVFGWEKDMPRFVHIPLTLKPDGKGKLSKRDGDRLGFPVFPLEWINPETGEKSTGYRESGYLPEAFINILAFLGWPTQARPPRLRRTSSV
jgi:glutamyl-tRNA synthetase